MLHVVKVNLVTFKEIKKRVSLVETTQQQQSKILIDYATNPSGYGIYRSIKEKISELKETAASTIFVDFP
jgi:hypothetical protein